MRVLREFGGPWRFATRVLGNAAWGVFLTLFIVFLARFMGEWLGGGRLVERDMGPELYFFAWVLMSVIVGGVYYLTETVLPYRRVSAFVPPLLWALGGYLVLGFPAYLGVRYNLAQFLGFWLVVGGLATFAARGSTEYLLERIPRNFQHEIAVRARWVRGVTDQMEPGFPVDLRDFCARQMMATLMVPFWQNKSLTPPPNAALIDLAELPPLARELVDEVKSEQGKAIFRAVLRALLAEWLAIHFADGNLLSENERDQVAARINRAI